MDVKYVYVTLSVLFVIYFPVEINGLLKRCFVCRSRGELGSCKDPFDFNVTQVENVRGLSTIPCASGWCAKIVETENTLRDEYAVATQRVCLQRGPSDSEDRCAYTKWNYRKVLMCFCKGDLCNSSTKIQTHQLFYVIVFFPILKLFL